MKKHTVIGPPGTGKTTFLARQVARAVDHGEAPTVVSLTKAAAKEAAGRNLPLDPERISTLHAQCYRALGNPEIADSAKGIKEWNEHCPPYALSGNVELDDTTGSPIGISYGDELMLAFQAHRARMLPHETLPDEVAYFAARWNGWKTQQGILDFTDLLEVAHETLSEPPLPSSVLFVDEAQDMSKLEMAVINQWAENAGYLITVGDPYQCLYEWRGTDPDGMANPDQVLSQSYRVPAAVHRFALDFLSSMPGYKEISYAPRDYEGEVRRESATWMAPEYGQLLARVESDINNDKTVMLLTSCGYMLQPLINLLRDRGIAFHNPYRRRAYSWNPLFRRASTKLSAVQKVLGFLRPSHSHIMKWDEQTAWMSSIYQKHLLVKRKELTEEKPVTNTVDFDFVANRVTEEALAAWMNGDLDWLHEAIMKNQKSMRYPIHVARSNGFAALEKEPQVIVGTCHSTKGGEADSVYLFPDLSRKGAEEWETVQGRAAIHRLFYVGATRARETLTLMDPSSGMAVLL